METWKQIDDFEVSNLGNVKINGVLKKLYYQRYVFVANSLNEVKSVHRLIAIAFIPNPDNKPQVNHINGIKTDNRVENLEWVTASENAKHSRANKLQVNKKGKDSPLYGKIKGESIRAKKVIDIVTGIIYTSVKEAYLTTPYSYINTCRQLTGERRNKTNLRYL